jgi:hypothetical protein
MINVSIQTRVAWTSPVVNTSRRFYIDTAAGFLYMRLISHSEIGAQIT